MLLEGLFKAEWKKEHNLPVIFLFCRDKQGVKKVGKIYSFEPYFYVLKDENSSYSYITKEEASEKKTLLTNEAVKKVYVRFPSDVYEARKLFKTSFEADVMFVSRFLIDKVTEMQAGKYRVIYFDIETTSDQGFPQAENPIEQIISISLYDSIKEKYLTLLLQPTDKIIPQQETDNSILIPFKTEEELLTFFLKFLHQIDFDIIVAWNAKFDMRYTFARCTQLNISYSTYLGETKLDKWGDAHIFGRVSIDLLQAFKKIYLAELQSYSLDNVSKEILGEDSGKLRILNIGEKWRENPMFIADYNRRDVELMVKIDNKVKILNYWEEIKNIAHLPSIDQCMAYSLVLDNLILRVFKDQFVFPNKVHYETSPKIGGGFVKEPEKGIHEWVYVYDFSAMYPSIIKTFNLSRECIIDDEEKYCDYVINNTRWISEFQKKGVLPQILDYLMEWRKLYQLEMKKYPVGSPEYELFFMKQFSAKFLVNSAYGTTAFPSFRLYDARVGDTITYVGRTVAQFISQKLEENTNYKVIYGDSVTGDTKILISDYTYQRIEDLWSQYASKIILRRDGKEEVLNPNFKILTCNDFRNEFTLPSSFIRYKTTKKLYTLYTTNEDMITVTADHSIFSLEKGKIILKKASALKMGDKLLFSSKIPNTSSDKNLSKEFYEFLGYWIGDGSYNRKSNIYISAGLDLEELIIKIITPTCNMFHCNYHVSEKNDINISSTKLNKLMHVLGFFGTSYTKRIPKWIFEETEENICSFLRGYFSADGSVLIPTLNKNGRIIVLSSVNKELLEDARILLNIVGIPASIFKEGKPNKYVDKETGITYEGKYSFRLVILYNEKFCKKIGFLLNRKNTKLLYSLCSKGYRNRLKASLTRKTTRLKNLENYDFCYRRISKIIEQPIKETYVYDFSIPNYEKFYGNGFLVHNTDSIFVKVGKFDLDEGKRIESLLGEYTADVINRLSFNTSKNYMKVELDKVYDKLLLCEKKRYAGRIYFKGNETVKNRKIQFVGVDIKRNNIPTIVREGLKEYVNLLFNDIQPNEELFVCNYVKKIRETTEITAFMIPTKLEKVYKVNVPQQRAADFGNNEFKLNLKPGSKFYGVYVKKLATDFIGFDIPERIQQYQKYINKDKYVEMFLDKIKLLFESGKEYEAERMGNTQLTRWLDES